MDADAKKRKSWAAKPSAYLRTVAYAQLLADRRRKLGLSVAELAERANLDVETIERIEAGRASGTTTLRRLRAALGLNQVGRPPQVFAIRIDGATLRRLREERGLTQESFAAMAITAVVTISRLERGKCQPSRATLANLARALGVDEEALHAPPSPTSGQNAPAG
jgi:transcriptional regulator with XRE-family HTH domain